MNLILSTTSKLLAHDPVRYKALLRGRLNGPDLHQFIILTGENKQTQVYLTTF